MSINEKKENPAKVAAVINTPSIEVKKEPLNEYEAEIVLGGKARIIKKLKAGEFYKAQQAFAEILNSVSIGGGINPADIAQGKIDPNNPEQLKKLASKTDISKVMKVMSEAPSKMAKFVAVCAQIPEAELLEEAYPEEISAAFDVCYRLNNVAENLKNFGAPMRTLGAALK